MPLPCHGNAPFRQQVAPPALPVLTVDSSLGLMWHLLTVRCNAALLLAGGPTLCSGSTPPCIEVKNKALLATRAAPARDQPAVNDPPAGRRGACGQQTSRGRNLFVCAGFLLLAGWARVASGHVTHCRAGVSHREPQTQAGPCHVVQKHCNNAAARVWVLQ